MTEGGILAGLRHVQTSATEDVTMTPVTAQQSNVRSHLRPGHAHITYRSYCCRPGAS